jgi:ribosomal protein L2
MTFDEITKTTPEKGWSFHATINQGAICIVASRRHRGGGNKTKFGDRFKREKNGVPAVVSAILI